MTLAVFYSVPVLAVLDDVPCLDETWQYSDVSGKCYRFVGKSAPLKWAEASAACLQSLSTQSNQSVRLIQFSSEDELRALIEIMLRLGNMDSIWLDAHRDSSGKDFRWQNGTEPLQFPFLDWSEGRGNGQCLELSYLTSALPTSSNWKMDVTLQETDCEERKPFLCEHDVQLCQNPPGGFDNSSMVLTPPKAAPRKVFTVVCKEGSYMTPGSTSSRSVDADVNDTLGANQYYCDGKRDPSGDPQLYVANFKYSGYLVSKCARLQCPLYPQLLKNVENAPELPQGTTQLIFNFGETIDLNCTGGYVSLHNATSTVGRMECSQVDRFAAEGVWIPENYQVCVAVRCDLDELKSMVPKNAFLSSARNYQTDRLYAQHQVNEFSYYGNVITIRCNNGFLYPDRTTEKLVICKLAENSKTNGVYGGYGGTSLPLPGSCEATTCMYENAVIKHEHHMKPYFLIQNGTGDWMNVSKHEGIPYALQAKIRFFCEEGFETVNQNEDFNITCSDTGLWSPQLIGCIAKTAEIPSTNTGRFYTEPEEAKSAKAISSIMLILIFIFLGFVILLDLTTIGRDMKQLWSNLKLQQKRISRGRFKMSANNNTGKGESAFDNPDENDYATIRNRYG
ncbi:Sushi/SCR/CCP domain-containing protein [Fasciola gigantica]|uniref:Sushi/SCR/CCP domain-containing protein n=1 Tax=Fasciola gigantica TaxID=46835 RepID=A0A504Z6P6_FASGI|nr:Sushi/SCR/CCP domain-containing protein [Fasciola gigantica]